MSTPSKDWNAQTAKVYDFFAPVTTFYAQHAVEALREPISAAGDSVIVLDNAAGTGAFALEAAREYPNVDFIAADVSEHQLKIAEAKAAQSGLKNVQFKVMDGQALELENDSVDAVVCQFGLMFFPDQAKGWSEMFRVLKPGSTAVVATWSNPGILSQVEEARAELLSGEGEEDNLPFFSVVRSMGDPEQLQSGATSAGFSHVQVYPLEFTWKAWPKEETEQNLEVFLKIPMFARAIPEGKEAEFKQAFTRLVESMADETGVVTIPYYGMITVARK